MHRPGGALALLLLSALAPRPAAAQTRDALDHYDLQGAASWRAELPAELAEVSGLAFTPEGRLLAHGDERAVVWRYDLENRRSAGRFGLGDRGGVLRGDFEDITVVGERLFLVTGAGAIYEGRIAPDGMVGRAARRIESLGGGCEVEGMTWDPVTESLLLLCKSTRSRRWKESVVILAVSPDTWRFERQPRILVPEGRLKSVTGEKRFNGSGLTRHPRTGTYLLVAGPQHAFAEVNAAGEVLGGGRLDRNRHGQPEGIAVAPDLTLLISDEAVRDAAAITAYAFRDIGAAPRSAPAQEDATQARGAAHQLDPQGRTDFVTVTAGESSRGMAGSSPSARSTRIPHPRSRSRFGAPSSTAWCRMPSAR